MSETTLDNDLDLNESVSERDAATTASVPRALHEQIDLLTRLRTRLTLSYLIMALLAAVLLLSTVGHLWRILNPPKPEYFATTADGLLIPMIPISEPYIPQETLLAWVTEAVTRAYTLDYVHYRQQLTSIRPDFTAEGYRQHEQALLNAGTIEAVLKRRLVTQVVPESPPIVVNSGVLADRFVWKIQMKIKISYEGASQVSRPQQLTADILVVRVPTNELARGIAIHQLVTRGQ